MIHDHITSTMNMAKVLRDSIDPKTTHTSVRNETLKLLIETIIELGTPNQHIKLDRETKRTVEGMIAPTIIEDAGIRNRWT